MIQYAGIFFCKHDYFLGLFNAHAVCLSLLRVRKEFVYQLGGVRSCNVQMSFKYIPISTILYLQLHDVGQT